MELSGIDYLSFDCLLRRGTGKVLEEGDDHLLLRDTMSKAYFLACDDSALGISVLDRYADHGLDLLMVTNHELGNIAFDRYGFKEKEECRQAAYYGPAPAPDDSVSIRNADLRDFPMISANYDMISPEELRYDVERGALYICEHDGQPVGFIGEHTEGSIGMLFVFPEHRNKGYAEAMEKYMFAKKIKEGFIPFGQVILGNDASFSLQKKMGLTMSDNIITWMWK